MQSTVGAFARRTLDSRQQLQLRNSISRCHALQDEAGLRRTSHNREQQRFFDRSGMRNSSVPIADPHRIGTLRKARIGHELLGLVGVERVVGNRLLELRVVARRRRDRAERG